MRGWKKETKQHKPIFVYEYNLRFPPRSTKNEYRNCRSIIEIISCVQSILHSDQNTGQDNS